MILVPAVDVHRGRVVRLVHGDPARETSYGEDPAEAARRFAGAGARLVHLVDLDAALGTGDNAAALAAAAAACREAGAEVQVGGGLRTLADVERVLRSGAGRAVLGTAAAADPAMVTEAVVRFGDRVVVALDVRRGRVLTHGWTRDAGRVDDLLPALDAAGAPRFLVTAIGADGTLTGPDLALYERTGRATARPVLASGGVRSVEDLRALAAAGVEGAVVGKALHEGRLPLAEALAALAGVAEGDSR